MNKIIYGFWAIIIVILIGIMDYIAGKELSLYLLYLFPIYYATWNLGRFFGIFISFFISIVWIVVDWQFNFPNISYGYSIYDFFVRFALFSLISILLSNNKKLLDVERKSARIDKKTGALNEKALYEILEIELIRLERHNISLCIVYFDMDKFKSVNDVYGHAAGDRVLVIFSEVVTVNIRAEDSFSRIGGDEFVLILPYSAIDNAFSVVGRIKTSFYARIDGYDVTLSTGIVEVKKSQPISELIHIADEEMYNSKKKGADSISFRRIPESMESVL